MLARFNSLLAADGHIVLDVYSYSAFDAKEETSTFEQILSSNTTSDNTYWESVTRLRLDIVKDLKLAVGYTVQGNTDVDGDTEKTDRYTAITLDYVW